MIRQLRYILCMALTLTLLATVEAYPQQSSKMRQLENKRKALLAEIDRTSKLITETEKSRKVSLRKLNLLVKQVNARKEIIETLTTEIATVEQEISKLQTELEKLTREFEVKQTSYVRSLQAMQHRSYAQEQLLFILSAKDFDQGIRRARYLKEYAGWQKQEATKLKALHAVLEVKRNEMIVVKEEKTSLLNKREEERTKLQQSEEESRKEVNKLRQQKKDLEADLSKKRKQAQALNREIEQQIAKEVAAAAERERKRKQEEKRETPSPGKKSPTTKTQKKTSPDTYAMNNEELKLSGNFANNKGKLPSPITGSYSIVGSFGEHAHERLAQIRVNNNGIDLQGQANADARAVFDGVVTRIFVVEGYNNSVMVRHGNYITVYSNLVDVYVKSGDRVTAGQKLGKVFSDPDMGGASLLHFQIWKEKTKLNPQSWIRR